MDDMKEEMLAQFTGITDASVSKAEQYLKITDWNLEQAIELFFASDGVDLDPTPAATSNPAAGSSSTAVQPPTSGSHQLGRSESDAIRIDDDSDTEEAIRRAAGGSSMVDEDALMAQRLQEELYAEAGRGGGGSAGPGGFGEDDIRAPIARTTETLVGPDDDYIGRMMAQRARGGGVSRRGPVGIFNQRPPTDNRIWDEEGLPEPERQRRRLAQATNGASETSSRASRLASLYNPPFDLIDNIEFEFARDLGKEKLKWIMVNIQDATVFDSQILNRDIWKDPAIKATVKENFIFLQYAHDSPEGQQYINLYLQRYDREFPHIGIIDPRTGELVKSWTRVPDKNEFVMQLHEFLERYSLDPSARNPVQKQPKPKPVDVDKMTEEEMLEWALKNSMGEATPTNDSDPDLLTKVEGKQKQTNPQDEDLMQFDETEAPSKASEPEPISVFASISKDAHHDEPPAGQPGVTRIQFRLSDGTRVVRRFALTDPVRRIFEYVKADLLPEQSQKSGDPALATQDFELKSLRQNLIDIISSSIEEAGLKMATVMVDMES